MVLLRVLSRRGLGLLHPRRRCPCQHQHQHQRQVGGRGLASQAGASSAGTARVLAYLAKVQEKADNLEAAVKKGKDDVEFMQLYNLLRPHIAAINLAQDERRELEQLRSSDDSEMREAAAAEMEAVDQRIGGAVEATVDVLLRPQGFDDDAAIVEVVPGAGGAEAGIFALEIFNMYVGYMQSLGFDVDVTEFESSKVQLTTGISRATADVAGTGVFSLLKYETGVHRVQRVPVNSTRMQTSTCSVAVLPRPDLAAIDIDEKDLSWTAVRASGPGGQGVNTANTAVRLVHVPTGIAVNAQETRSQLKNRKSALEKLKLILYQRKFESEQRNVSRSRRSQIGNMDRNEKIRTFHFGRNQVTDHRLSESRHCNLEQLLSAEGNYTPLAHFSELLRRKAREERLDDILSAGP